MEVSKIKKSLVEQKNIDLSGNLYHKTQLDFVYNTNHIEGSTITPDETASIYDTGTILTSGDKVIVLKDGILTNNEKEWFNVGEYKKKKNFVGNITTSLPSNAVNDMKDLMKQYDKIDKKSIGDIVEFHVRFEKIHPFQEGNGRVERIIMFRDCIII